MFINIFATALLYPLEYVKWILAALYVISTIGVAIGVYWENDGFPKAKQQKGWQLLLLSLAADTFFTILIFATDGWINHIQQPEIIALETRLAARTLSEVQAADIKGRLSNFAGQTFQIIPYWKDNESMATANRIAEILIASDWKIDQPKTFTTLVGVVTGVLVAVDKGASASAHRAAQELISALNDNHIDAAEDEENNNPNPSPDFSNGVGASGSWI